MLRLTANLVRVMDSTFTVPRGRFRALLTQLARVGIRWDAFTRANAIDSSMLVESLEAACCGTLTIGFESMSDASLRYMNKRVTAAENLRCFELLADSEVHLRASFMVGYPGETPGDYEETHRFLVERFSSRFMLFVFSLVDETMPVWEDAARFQLEVTDEEDVDQSWRHSGMDADTARELQQATVKEVRWGNEEGVMLLWQGSYQLPLVPVVSRRQNQRLEKLIERLAFLPKDFGGSQAARGRCLAIVEELERLGVYLC